MATSTVCKHHIGFLDLPGEIRNHVYQLCLTVSEDVRMAARIHEHDFGYKIFVTDDGSDDSMSATRACLQPAILSTCRTIYEEATPMLYGSNQFQLSLVFWEGDYHTICECTDRDACPPTNEEGIAYCQCQISWPTDIGRNVEHLRNVRISEYTPHLLASALESLLSAWGLDKLLIDYDPAFHMPAPTMAQKLLPFLRWLQVNRKPDQKPVIDVLEFVPVKEPGTPWGAYWGEPRKEVDVLQLEEYAAKIRAILRQELEDQRLCNSLWDIDIF